MDIASAIVGALAASAPKAIGEIASSAIKDGYHALKKLIERQFKDAPQVLKHVDALELSPSNKSNQEKLRDSLSEKPELLDADFEEPLRRLLNALTAHAPDAGRAVGVDIGELSAAVLNMRNIRSPVSGTGVRIQKATIAGAADFDFGGHSDPKV